MFKKKKKIPPSFHVDQADLLLVNSKYTLTVVNEVFPNLTTPIHVVYPGICDPFPPTSTATFPSLSWLTQVTFPIFVSINRYEKKKDLSLALQAFALFPTSKSVPSLLIFIGGYDSRVQENVATLTTLTKLCASLNLPYSMTLPTSNPFTSSPSTASTSSSIPTSTKHVLFLRNLDEPMKHAFISMATAVLYTPSHEHFGIVPIESMALGTPVIAMANGGPLETVVHLQTGYLCPSMSMSSVVNEWVQGMQWGVDVQRSNERRTVVQHHCQMRVKDLFTRDRMVEQLGQLLQPLLCQVASPTSFQSVEQEEEKKDKEK
ncbi:Alpha-1,3-mannosyltransferase-like protein [Coelomomyces lativittatus]|nr:Alpha-1,3-mannosyltransferase-like protein [Coelomomyces lativittatus]